MDYVIVTGASRGVGAEMARQLMKPDTTLFCISRSVNSELIEESQSLGVNLHWIQANLRETGGIPAFMVEIADSVEENDARQICLINNAASLAPIGPVGAAYSAGDDGNGDGEAAYATDLASSVHVNLIAPMLLTHYFLVHFGRLTCDRVVINVSSGAAMSPMPGLSTYSATKAGLNMFTAAAAADDSSDPAVRFYAVSPGIVDTDMQAALRAAGPERLRQHGTYETWKENGSLIAPEEAAQRVLSLLSRTDIENGSYVHARDLK